MIVSSTQLASVITLFLSAAITVRFAQPTASVSEGGYVLVCVEFIFGFLARDVALNIMAAPSSVATGRL